MTRMFRSTDVILFAVMVGAAGYTYKVKHGAELQLEHIRKLEAKIRYEEDSIDLLKADWSLLTQPARLQKLSETFQAELKLSPVVPKQFAGMDAVPLKPPPPPDEIMKIIAEQDGVEPLADAPSTDAMTTGGIDR